MTSLAPCSPMAAKPWVLENSIVISLSLTLAGREATSCKLYSHIRTSLDPIRSLLTV